MYEKIEYHGLEIVLRYYDGHSNPLDRVDAHIYPTEKKRPYETLVYKRRCVNFRRLVKSYRYDGMTGKEAHYRALNEVAKIKAIYNGTYVNCLISAEYENVRSNVFTSEDCRSIDFYDYWGYSPSGEKIKQKKDSLDIKKDDLIPLMEDVITQAIDRALEEHDYYVLRDMQNKMGAHFWVYALFGCKERYAEILNIPYERMGVI